MSLEPAKPTCKPMVTTLRFEGHKDIVFDIDSGSSHNVMSVRSFKKIWPCKGPKLFPKTSNITLADGSTSKAPIRSMECAFVAPNGQRFKQHFYVVKGPHNLLGRFGMKCIWPREYSALAAVAEAPHIKKHDDFQLRSAESAVDSAAVRPRTSQARAERPGPRAGTRGEPDLPQQRAQSPPIVPAEFINV